MLFQLFGDIIRQVLFDQLEGEQSSVFVGRPVFGVASHGRARGRRVDFLRLENLSHRVHFVRQPLHHFCRAVSVVVLAVKLCECRN